MITSCILYLLIPYLFFSSLNSKDKKSVGYWLDELPKIKELVNIAKKFKKTNCKIKPIFLIGVPRCGSTLVEKIITSCPKSIPMGEETGVFSMLLWDQIRQKENLISNMENIKIDLNDTKITNINTEEFAYNPQPNLKMTNDNLRVSYTDKGISKIVDINGENKSIVYENNSKILQLCDSTNKTVFIENNRNMQEVVKVLNKQNNEIHDILIPNSKFYKENPPSKMNKFTINRTGFDIESRVYLPSNFSESNTYPLIVDIHGGPHGRFEDQIAVNQEIFTKNGYIVIAVNPRGSSSYGSDFGKAVLNDWGGEDYYDIIESVNKLSKEKYIDSNKIGLYGYSYGGFMSSWIIGHTNQFKAAVIGAPCINLNSMSGTSDIGIKFGEEQWGGLRHDNVEKYQFNSPLTYAKNVTTPSIILVGDRDYRCPIEQAEQYFVTLKRMGNDVQLVRYPGGNHGMLSGSAPNLVIDFWTRAVNFFDKNLK